MSRIKNIVPEEVDRFDEPEMGSVYQTLIIRGSLVTLNEHDNTNRRNRFAGAALKKRMTEFVASQCGPLEPITEPVSVHITWNVSTRHDPDNIAFAKKYVLDGMIKAGKLPNDNQQWILGLSDKVVRVPKGEELIIVHISPSKAP